MARASSFAFKLRYDALCEFLTEFNAPLVKRVDAPDGALGEDAVLVEGDELAEGSGFSRSSRIVFDGRLPSKTR